MQFCESNTSLVSSSNLFLIWSRTRRYGNHFTKDSEGNPWYHVWWGAQPAEENEYKCPEVMSAAVPRQTDNDRQIDKRIPLSLVRSDGMVVVPTGHMWTDVKSATNDGSRF
jgi:hypothetical protein